MSSTVVLLLVLHMTATSFPCRYPSTSATPATSSLSVLLCSFASVLSYSSHLLACFFSPLLCRCAFVVGKTVMSVSFMVSSTQARVSLRLRLLCPCSSTVVLLFSLTVLASLPTFFLRSYVKCSFAVRKTVMSATFVVPSRKYV